MANHEFSEHEKNDNPHHPSWIAHRRRLAESDDALNTFDMSEVWPELQNAGSLGLDEQDFHPLLPNTDPQEPEPPPIVDES